MKQKIASQLLVHSSLGKIQMKQKNLFSAIFGIILVLAFASMVSASIWFDFEANPSASSMTVSQGQSLNLVLTASSHNNIVVSQEKLEAIPGGLLASWNEPGTQFGSTHLWTKTHTLDTNVLGAGTFTLRFSAQTNSGLESADLTLIINPSDTTAPVITILGSNPITIALGSVYTDAGATALDNLDGDITANIVVVNSVNTAVAGTYTVTYSVSDLAGNSATATRTVIVSASSDVIAPTVVISSPTAATYTMAPTNITYVPSDTNLNQCWYSLNGGVTNSTAVSCTSGVSNLFSGLVPQQGSNTWTVWANDVAGNLGSASVTFTVNDLTGPTIFAVSPKDNETLDDADVILKVSTNEDAVVKYSLNGAANVTMTKTSGFNFDSAPLLSLDEDEEYTVIYTATDLMGNNASLTIKFTIDEKANQNIEDTSFSTEDLDEISIEPAIDLTDEDAPRLNWWQRFINWLARLFGLEEVY